MMKWICLLIMVPLCADTGIELLSNGGFEGGDTVSFPQGWQAGGDGEVVWNRLNGGSSLILRSTAPKQFTFVRQTVPLPSAAAVRLVAEVRLGGVARGENTWHSGRIMLSYRDAAGQEIGNAYGLDRLEGDEDWQELSRQFPLEEGAVAVQVDLQLFYPASGEIEFRNVRLLALDETEAQAWRKEADERIARHRMADLHVTVLDDDGHPLADAELSVRMLRHAYPFGTAVKVGLLLSEDPEHRVYQNVVRNFFNSATFEGALKDRIIERDGIEPALKALHWLKERGVIVRGHVLIWPSWEMTAQSYKPLQEDPYALRAEIRRHFRETLLATEGLISEWDVLNEPIRHRDLIDLLGREAVVEWFKTAREFAPDIPLVLNENNVLLNSGNRQSIIELIRYLQAEGAPVDRLGVQGHMWHRTMPSGQTVLQDLEALEPLGLEIVLTEYSANARFSELQEARYLGELLHAWFSHPATVGFTTWGFKDDLIWTDNAFFFRKDWSLKPAGLSWLQKVFGDWWTESDGVSDAAGLYSLRAFKGDYVVEVRHNGRRTRRQLRLEGPEQHLEIRLDDSAEEDVADTRLGSFNPWTTGKLPGVRAPNVNTDRQTLAVHIPVNAGEGAMALVPDSDRVRHGVFPLHPPGQGPQDVYLRFDLSSVTAPDGQVVLRLVLANTNSSAATLRLYALSHRFVRRPGELGLDWVPGELSEVNAPGRSSSDGGFDLGDARVLYVGDSPIAESGAGHIVEFSSTELRRVVRQSAGKGLTLILSAPDEGCLAIAGSGHPDYPPPQLIILPTE